MAEVKEFNIDIEGGDSTQARVKFPPNSYKSKQQAENEKPKQQQVTTAPVKRKKKSVGQKFAETFLGDDSKSVGQYIVYDILLPAFKAMLSDAVGGGIEMLLFGERRRNGVSGYVKRDGSRSYVSYGSYYRGDMERERNPGPKERSSASKARHEFDDIIFDSRGEAEEVLSHLADLTVDYGMASLADFYDLAGITSSFTDNKYGWTDLHDAGVRRDRDGYRLDLPRTKLLD